MSWREFLLGKRRRKDVAEFSLHLMDNILGLHNDLENKTYRHGGYHAFKINDPKPRDIHKASVRDRLVHHAIYRILYPYFDKRFIHDSYSCLDGKGTHRAVNRFKYFAGKVSRNNTRTVWVLKCDIKKFFANIDHGVLQDILMRHIQDEDVLWLLYKVIDSFHTQCRRGVGLPLGNLTSQLLVNIYMNEFDHFVKRELKAKYYTRYADDFVILSEDKDYLEEICLAIGKFLAANLKLELNLDKTSIQTLASGVDFLGYVIFPQHVVLRTTTKRRAFKRVNKNNLPSYLGLVSHCKGYKIAERFKEIAEYKD